MRNLTRRDFNKDALEQPSILEDYDVKEPICTSGSSLVLRVICKRGRLRNRQLALKKIPAISSPSQHTSLPSLHQALHHPNIVSLYAVVRTPLDCFHVLEFCSQGNLFEYRRSLDTMTWKDTEVRRVLKGLVDALLFLKREGIVHRDLNPYNVLLTDNLVTKLSNFKNAIHLESLNSIEDILYCHPNYTAPESTSSSNHHSIDVWSLGCVACFCFSGEHPFEQGYLPLDDMSPELKDLTSKTLQERLEDRIDISHVLSQAFFDVFTSESSNFEGETSLPINLHSLQQELAALNYPSKLDLPRRSVRFTSSDTGNINIRRNNSFDKHDFKRRIVSDPLPQKSHPINTQGKGPRTVDLDDSTPKSLDQSFVAIPLGTHRPSTFDTKLLSPKSHKSTFGSITILPSLSLLVDFRKNQRRHGMKGDEVLVISPDGKKIDVYHAPYLSTPSCLTEPVIRFSIERLPPGYWNVYNDARTAVDQIKRRTPKLILHTPVARCTLMANGPLPDIELLFENFPALNVRSPGQRLGNKLRSPKLRIRFSRQHTTVEISRHLVGIRGEEWTKKILTSTCEDELLAASDWETLTIAEQDGIRELSRFLKLCKALDTFTETEVAVTYKAPISPLDFSLSLRRKHLDAELAVVESTSLVKNVRQPPAKIQISEYSKSDLEQPLETGLSVQTRSAIFRGFAQRRIDMSEAELSPSNANHSLQGRFIPSVGWCIKIASQTIGHNDKYKVMFTDGVMMQVNPDEDAVDLVTLSGDTERYNFRDAFSRPRINEFMKIFQEFVCLFQE